MSISGVNTAELFARIYTEVVWILGVGTLIVLALRAIHWIKKWLQLRRFVWHKGDGQLWAVVTGATDGIGFEFARQLAHKNYNLILVSRSELRLEASVQRITQSIILQHGKCDVKFRTLAVDFSQVDIYNQVKTFLQPYLSQIFILVNNVGHVPEIFGDFVEEEGELHQSVINVNVIAMTKMTHLILPAMIKHRRGLVVNLSSVAAHYPMPTFTVYGATKAYVAHFSRALAEECRQWKVHIVNFSPSFVATKVTHGVKACWLVPSAEKVVTSALNSIRYLGDNQTDGYWSHRATHSLLQLYELITSSQQISHTLHCTLREIRGHYLKVHNANVEQGKDSEMNVGAFTLLAFKGIFKGFW